MGHDLAPREPASALTAEIRATSSDRERSASPAHELLVAQRVLGNRAARALIQRAMAPNRLAELNTELSELEQLEQSGRNSNVSNTYKAQTKVGLGFTYTAEQPQKSYPGGGDVPTFTAEPPAGKSFALDRLDWIIDEAQREGEVALEQRAQNLRLLLAARGADVKAVAAGGKSTANKKPISHFGDELQAPLYFEWGELAHMKKGGLTNEAVNSPMGWNATVLKALQINVKHEQSTGWFTSKEVSGKICFNIFGLTAGDLTQIHQKITNGETDQDTAQWLNQGLKITHQELAIIMTRPDLWARTDFFYYDLSLTHHPVYLENKDPRLAALGIRSRTLPDPRVVTHAHI